MSELMPQGSYAEAGDTPIRRAMTPVANREGLVFRGTPTPWPGAYGGDLMTHCSGAARHGRQLGRLISASFEFLRASDPVEEVTATAEVVRAGRSITHVRVVLDQLGSEKLAAMLVYETTPANEDVPEGTSPGHTVPQQQPNDLRVVVETDLGGLPESFQSYYAATRGLDVRYISKPPFVEGESAADDQLGESENWTRVLEPADVGNSFSEASLCYIADDSALEPVLNEQGISWLNADADIVTLSHSMRFSGVVRPGEWLHCKNRLHLVSGRYVETRGLISSRDGRVVASTHQLGIRVGHA